MKKNKTTPLIIAHRGYSENFAENSIEAFKQALKYPVHGVELDIQRSSDGNYFIIHDDNIFSEESGPVPIANINSKQINKLRSTKNPLPRLEDFLKNYPTDRFVNFELKWSITKTDLPIIYSMITKRLNPLHIMISSFNPELLFFFKKHKLTIGLLIGEPPETLSPAYLIKSYIRLRPKWINPPVLLFFEKKRWLYKILLSFFKPFVKYAFYTVNSKHEYDLCKKYANAIFTDKIEEALKWK